MLKAIETEGLSAGASDTSRGGRPRPIHDPGIQQEPPKVTQLAKAVEAFRAYIRNNAHLIPNYGERYRYGEAITTSFVESTVNEVVSKRFCKQQQMQWSTAGAHLLLQTRVQTLNGDLSVMFKRWYPDMDIEVEAEGIPAAA
jgi:hypothetical protein